MKKNCLPGDRRNCGHCHAEGSISYYKESATSDYYYCDKCYMVTEWDGMNKTLVEMEAYPDRDKK